MTDQELFDECVSHVIMQGKPAYWHSTCQYLTLDGLSCAVGGPIVKRKLYRSIIESTVVYNLTPEGLYAQAAPASWNSKYKVLKEILGQWGVQEDQYQLLTNIQQAHDRNASEFDFMSRFKSSCRETASYYKLDDVLVRN